ncbi:MAG: alpha/beta fold hydrolase [Ignavibacteria bacterium]|nr:alpha/beta fold hydrolase [Ignavibacteria bacterium]
MKYIINSLSVNTFGDPENIPVIFVHGFPFDYSMWENQIAELKNDYYCISYDVRGLGDSYVGDGQYTMDAFASDLFSIVHEMNINQPVLCGLSMGGYIILRTLQRDSKRFRGVVLCNTKASGDDNEAKLKRAQAIDDINVKGLDFFVSNFVPNCFSDFTKKKNPELVEKITQNAKRHIPKGVKGSVFAMLSRNDTNEILPKLEIPALVIAGKDDKITPVTAMKEMADKIKDSDFTEIPNAAHLTPLENPEKFNKALKEFLDTKITK